MIPLNGNNKFRQGLFRPKNTSKYVGRTPPVYRSGWELKFFRWCDENNNVLEWASEAVIIPYINPVDGKAHRYYTDGIVAIKENDSISKYIIEIKPSNQLLQPVAGKKKQSTLIFENKRYIQNMAKWSAAKKWCQQRNYKFLILTEKELGLK
ncbi:head completion protein [bacterium]|nr:head completion protein [bacterium]